jgi:glucose-1-phosphate thymidylyltransferase
MIVPLKTVMMVGDDVAHQGAARPRPRAKLTALEPVANRPIVHHALDALREVSTGGIIFAGDADALLDVRDSLDELAPGLDRVGYVVSPSQAGIAHALSAVAPLVGDAPCLIQPADGLLDEPVMRLVDLLDEWSSDLVILVPPPNVDDPEEDLGQSGQQPEDLGEFAHARPWHGIRTADVAVFAPGALCRASERITVGDSVDLAAAGEWLAAGGASVHLHAIDGWHRYRGHGDDLLKLNRVALDRLVSSVPPPARRSNRIEGVVAIDPTAQVRSSVIVGPAVIGPDASVTDAYIGPYTSIGSRARIEGAEIERSIVSPGASVLHIGSRLVSSLVGRDTRIFRDFTLPRALRLWTGEGDEVALC